MIGRLPPVLALCAVLAAALGGCGSSSSSSDDQSAAKGSAATNSVPATPPPAATAGAASGTTSAGCRKVAAPTPKGTQHLEKPTLRLTKPASVVLRTNCGTITITLDVKRAPKTASSFASLVEKGFYNHLTFHRIVPGFVIQGGDPLGTGQGGPGYSVVEKAPSDLKYTKGVVAMAKTSSDPSGASGSQFFIVTGADAGLPPDYALVGKVSGSFAAVTKIEATPADASQAPIEPVVIEKATLRTG